MSDLFAATGAARHLVVPRDDDDKYARGVVGFVTGSPRYPGAAVLGVEAALRTGVGMVRYLGPGRATRLVLQRRPEAVTAEGRVQAWVLGSGWDPEKPRDELLTMLLEPALAAATPLVLDAGALALWPEVVGPTVLTPHAGELARLLGIEREEVAADREAAVRRAAEATGGIVLLKGAETLVADPQGRLERVRNATPWLATAGAGDALAGILGALLATDPDGDRVGIAAAAAWIHGEAARRASGGGPFTILDLCAELPRVVADLVAGTAPDR